MRWPFPPMAFLSSRAILVVVLLAAQVASAGGRQHAYAIVIGNNAPPAGTPDVLRPLHYADDDAVRYYELFSRFADAHLLVVLDATTQRRYPNIAAHASAPTAANLRRVVDDLAAAMKADRERGDRPVLYFAFSGHGARDDRGRAFLALLDEPLTQDMLYDLLGRLPTDFTHVIVDACHAGGVVGVRGSGFFASEADTRAAPATAAEIEPLLQTTPLARHPNIGVIVATTLGEESHEWSAVESGVFTHELLSGLVGAADINGDLAIEYSEIQAFVASANRDLSDPRAAPHIVARPPAANLREPILSLRTLAGTRLMRGDASSLGHFHVELDNGVRYVDAHLDHAVAIAVPDDTPAFLRTVDGEVALPVRGAIALAQLALRPLAAASRGSIDSALRSALFASSYGRAYYQGFIDSTGAIAVTFADTQRHDGARDSGRGRAPALGLAAIAGISFATSLTTGVLAYRARSDFESTQLQKPAYDAKLRYARYVPISIAAGATSIVAGVAAYWLWPRAPVRVVPRAEAGGYGVSMEATW